jgi:anthranilate synthase component 1
VSGAPKVRAMELIAELEREKRGVYAGAVGYFGYGSIDGDKEIEGAMDVSGLAWFELDRRLILADMHCAKNHACQRWYRVSPSRGKSNEFPALASKGKTDDWPQGGIVFDSDPYDEWMETINKLGEFNFSFWSSAPTRAHRADRCLVGANTHCITSAEEKHLAEQQEAAGAGEGDKDASASRLEGDAETRISLAAG